MLAVTYEHMATSGALAALAVMTALPAAPVAAAVVIASCVYGRRALARCFAAATVTFAMTNLATAAICGPHFVEQVYLYHLAKQPGSHEQSAEALAMLADSWPLFVGAVAGVLVLLQAGGLAARVAIWAAATAAAHAASMAASATVFYYYSHPLLLVGAILVGLAASVVLARVTSVEAVPLGETMPRTGAFVGVGCVGVVLLVLGPGSDESSVARFLRRARISFDAYPDLVAAVAREAQARPGTTLYGDSLAAPLVALGAGVRITGDLVDTNTQRFGADRDLLGRVIDTLEATPDVLVLSSERVGVGTLPAFRSYVTARYELIGAFPVTTMNVSYSLWRKHQPAR
jgi:hypothetical protein